MYIGSCERVLRALQAFQQEIKIGNPEKSRERHDRFMSDVFFEIRRDLVVVPADVKETFKAGLWASGQPHREPQLCGQADLRGNASNEPNTVGHMPLTATPGRQWRRAMRKSVVSTILLTVLLSSCVTDHVTSSEREPMILGLRTVIYPASDLAAAKQWYAQVLNQQPYFDEPFYVGFNVGGFELGLIPDGQSAISGPQPLWGVSDADATFERLLELGATSLEPVTDVGEGIKVAAVVDPFGNRFGIIENPLFDPAKTR